MRRSPFGLHPNGPYPTQGPPQSGDVVRQTSGTIDMRGAVGWRSVFSIDCGELVWGQVVVTGEAIEGTAAADIPAVVAVPEGGILAAPAVQRIERWEWIEVRIAGSVNGQTYTMLEAAVGSHDGPTVGGAQKTAGAVLLTFAPGEVPDRIEVSARSRRGGLEGVPSTDGAKLTLLATSRFHK